MDWDEFTEPEVGIAVAVTAAIASPKIRKVIRRGAVYGLAGLMKAKDMVVHGARSVAQTARDAASSLTSGGDAADEAAPAAKKKGRVAAAHE